MEIVLDKKSTTNATIKVQLTEADYQPKINAKLKEYGKNISLKGFRQGKVPAQLVEKMYGKSIKVDEINHLLTESVQNYVKDQNLKIIGYPLPDQQKAQSIDWDTQSNFEFYYEIGLIPDFKYELSDKVKVTKYTIKADAAKVEETIDNMRRQYGKMDDAETASEEDYLNGDMKEVASDFETKTLLPMNRIKKDALSLFLGKKAGDVITFDIEKIFEDASYIAYSTGLSKEEAATKKGKFTFTVTGVRRNTPAPLDQEMFDKVFGKDAVTNEADFRTRLLDTIQNNYTREAEALVARDVREYYLSNVKIDLDAEFLKRWLKVNNDGKMTDEQIENDIELYTKDLRWLLIRNKIGEDNSIQVDHQDVLNKTKELFLQQFGMSLEAMGEEMAETIDKVAQNYLTSENGKNYNRTFEEVYYTKVLQLIESKITLQEKSISVDEFEKLASAN
ncbi:MAG: trigger factor [Cytophagaceae bacterium]